MLGVSIWVAAPVIFVGWLAFWWLVKVAVYRHLRAISLRTRSPLDDIILAALTAPLRLIVVGTGLLLLERLYPLEAAWDKGFTLGFHIALILAVALFLDRFLRGLVKHYAATQPILQSSQGMVTGFTRILVVVIAGILLMDAVGISITPLIASLGVGSLAVALALQPTLSNFFAGMQLLADRTVEVGQLVRLDTGEEGQVVKVGWRSTRIRLLSNNLLLVPNARLIDSRVTNYSLPESELSVLVPVGVHYGSNLDHVEEVTLEVAREIQRTVPGAAPGFEPLVRYREFGESSIRFNVILRAREFTAQYLMTHEFVKQLRRRYDAEGIVIPYPIRTLEMGEEVLERMRPGPGPAS